MSALNTLSSLGKSKKRIGRGGARGGTSGRGHKGQNARSGGGVSVTYEGGQMPLVRRLPKRGFNNARFAKNYVIVTLEALERLFNEGDVVTRAALVEKGVLSSKSKQPLKVLATGKLSKKIVVHVEATSAAAAEMIKNLGGEVHLN